jgi:hypothetical protein
MIDGEEDGREKGVVLLFLSAAGEKAHQADRRAEKGKISFIIEIGM